MEKTKRGFKLIVVVGETGDGLPSDLKQLIRSLLSKGGKAVKVFYISPGLKAMSHLPCL